MLSYSPTKTINYIWLNGKIIELDQAKLSVLTHSLHYAGAVFEGEKAYGGKIFKLDEHINRLLYSANIMQLKVPYSFEQIKAAHHLVIEKNKTQNAYIRPLIWRGGNELGLVNKSFSVNLLILSIPSIEKDKKSYKLHVSRWQKPHPESMPPQAKSSAHYAMMIVAKQEAINDKYDDAILLDYRGYIAECTTTNIFFVSHGVIITPIADTFLNGITRQTIIELAKKLAIKVKEKHITLDDIEKYDECFLTGTAAEVLSVESVVVRDKEILFAESKITQLMQKEYSLRVNREF